MNLDNEMDGYNMSEMFVKPLDEEKNEEKS